MNNKLVKFDESKRMERIANLISEYATEMFTGWEFEVQQRDDGYYVETSRISPMGYVLHIGCLVGKETVEIGVISDGCKLQRKRVEQEVDKIMFPVIAILVNEELLLLKNYVTTSGLETDVASVVLNRMLLMMNAILEFVMGKIA